jgi:hypothetical protein
LTRDANGSKDPCRIAERIQALIGELVGKLPDGCAIARFKSNAFSRTFELVPTRSGGAPISLTIPLQDCEKVTLIAGRSTLFEIPVDGRWYTDFPLLDEVRTICMAVIQGQLEEWLILDGTEVVRGKGTIRLPRPITVHWSQSFRPFRKKTRAHFQYEPWIDERATQSGEDH